jgi:hypothetical protein
VISTVHPDFAKIRTYVAESLRPPAKPAAAATAPAPSPSVSPSAAPTTGSAAGKGTKKVQAESISATC